MNKAQPLTSCIVHLADSANIKGVTPNKRCSGLTGLCFESPNDTIHVTVIIAKGNTNHLIIKHLKNYLKKLCKTLESFKKIFNFAKLKI